MSSPQVVLITGCSKGIGKQAALFLARDSERRFKVYATMRNMATRQDALKTDAGSTLDDTLFIRELDVTKQETIDKTVKEIIDNEGQIDVLVNNAGILRGAWWETSPMETFYEVMDTNYFGCVRMTKAVVPHMKKKRSGRILQISSILGFHAITIYGQYVPAKFALEGFSESIAPPLRKFNIWVSVIEPAYVETEMVEQFGGDPIAIWDDVIKKIPGDEERKIVGDMLKKCDSDTTITSEMQPTQEVAQVIQDAILSPKPDYRYQACESIKRLAQRRFIDPTGNSTIEAWLKE